MAMKALVATLLLVGCASAARQTPPLFLPCPVDGLPAQVVREGSPPVPDGLFLPPLPIPASVRGARSVTRLVVDPTGRVMADSITVCGVPNRTYAEQVAARLARVPFKPARVNGQAVMSDVLIQYDF
jgi:hypothetical protein